MDPPPPLLPPLTAHPKTLLMSWDGGCKVSWIWNHRHLCLMALSPLSENCPQAWFPICSYISARLECFPNPLAQRKRNKLQTICSYCLNEMLQDLIKTHFMVQEILSCWHHSFMDMESHFPESFHGMKSNMLLYYPHKQIKITVHLSVAFFWIYSYHVLCVDVQRFNVCIGCRWHSVKTCICKLSFMKQSQCII